MGNDLTKNMACDSFSASYTIINLILTYWVILPADGDHLLEVRWDEATLRINDDLERG